MEPPRAKGSSKPDVDTGCPSSQSSSHSPLSPGLWWEWGNQRRSFTDVGGPIYSWSFCELSCWFAVGISQQLQCAGTLAPGAAPWATWGAQAGTPFSSEGWLITDGWWDCDSQRWQVPFLLYCSSLMWSNLHFQLLMKDSRCVRKKPLKTSILCTG